MTIVLVMLNALLVYGLVSAMHIREVTCTVIDKNIVESWTEAGPRVDLRIDTDKCGVLSVSSRNLFDSSDDIYEQIQSGHRYEMTVEGFRFLGMLPTVTQAVEISGR